MSRVSKFWYIDIHRGKEAGCVGRMLCGVLLQEGKVTHRVRYIGSHYITKQLLKMALNSYRSIVYVRFVYSLMCFEVG